MADELTRLRLEMNIEAKASAIDLLKSDVAWLDDPEWSAFRNACYDLVHYIEEQGEEVIGPHTLGVFDFIRLLRKALMSGELNEQRYEQAEDELLSLEHWIDEMRTYTMTNLRYHHPELDI